MKSLRGVSAEYIVRTLVQVEYSLTRQGGWYVPLLHPGPSVHSLSVSMPNPLKTGR